MRAVCSNTSARAHTRMHSYLKTHRRTSYMDTICALQCIVLWYARTCKHAHARRMFKPLSEVLAHHRHLRLPLAQRTPPSLIGCALKVRLQVAKQNLQVMKLLNEAHEARLSTPSHQARQEQVHCGMSVELTTTLSACTEKNIASSMAHTNEGYQRAFQATVLACFSSSDRCAATT